MKSGFRNKPHVNQDKWDDWYYVLAYRLATAGQKDENIARAMGVSPPLFAKWVATKPTLQRALEEGRSKRYGGVKAFMRHVADRMPDNLRELWEQLSSEDEKVRERACTDVHEFDMRHQQHVFLHALLAMNFNGRAACQATGIDHSHMMRWRREDRNYHKLMEIVEMAKGDFFENAFIDLVVSGDANAIIAANRSFNASRGYGGKLTVKMEGEVQHSLSLSVKDLSPETKARMLEELRRKKERDASPQLEDRRQDVVDAEFTKKG